MEALTLFGGGTCGWCGGPIAPVANRFECLRCAPLLENVRDEAGLVAFAKEAAKCRPG
jgi:hypothetical protein